MQACAATQSTQNSMHAGQRSLAGHSEEERGPEEEALIVYVDIKRRIAFPLDLSTTPRGSDGSEGSSEIPALVASPREAPPAPTPTLPAPPPALGPLPILPLPTRRSSAESLTSSHAAWQSVAGTVASTRGAVAEGVACTPLPQQDAPLATPSPAPGAGRGDPPTAPSGHAPASQALLLPQSLSSWFHSTNPPSARSMHSMHSADSAKLASWPSKASGAALADVAEVAEVASAPLSASERQCARTWFVSLSADALPLLAVLPDGQLCMCVVSGGGERSGGRALEACTGPGEGVESSGRRRNVPEGPGVEARASEDGYWGGVWGWGLRGWGGVAGAVQSVWLRGLGGTAAALQAVRRPSGSPRGSPRGPPVAWGEEEHVATGAHGVGPPSVAGGPQAERGWLQAADVELPTRVSMHARHAPGGAEGEAQRVPPQGEHGGGAAEEGPTGGGVQQLLGGMCLAEWELMGSSMSAHACGGACPPGACMCEPSFYDQSPSPQLPAGDAESAADADAGASEGLSCDSSSVASGALGASLALPVPRAVVVQLGSGRGDGGVATGAPGGGARVRLRRRSSEGGRGEWGVEAAASAMGGVATGASMHGERAVPAAEDECASGADADTYYFFRLVLSGSDFQHVKRCC